MAIQVNGVTAIDNSRNVIASGIVTVGSGNSTVTINGVTGITSIGIGVTIDGIAGNISIAGTLTAAGFNVPPSVTSFTPADGATNQITQPTVKIVFDQFITGINTTKNITFRSVSNSGTAIATIGIGSTTQVVVEDDTVTINLETGLPENTVIFPVVDAAAFRGAYDAPIAAIDDYNFTVGTIPALGQSYASGNLICKASNNLWIVAPISTEVGASQATTYNAVLCAVSVTGVTGWFVPTLSQLQNPGYTCKTYWDVEPTSWYRACDAAGGVNMANGYTRGGFGYDANNVWCTRAFRCVIY